MGRRDHHGAARGRRRGHRRPHRRARSARPELLADPRRRYDEAVEWGIATNRHRDWPKGDHPGPESRIETWTGAASPTVRPTTRTGRARPPAGPWPRRERVSWRALLVIAATVTGALVATSGGYGHGAAALVAPLPPPLPSARAAWHAVAKVDEAQRHVLQRRLPSLARAIG